jgi:two-component system OmpR family response regulator
MAAPATIMVVDDDPDIRRLVVTNLRSASWDVIEADSGALAIKIFEEKRPGIVLLDVMMPQMNGFEAAQKIRALDTEGDVQIVFLTAHGSIDNFKESLKVNARDFLTKPIARTELINRISALQKARSLRPERT